MLGRPQSFTTTSMTWWSKTRGRYWSWKSFVGPKESGRTSRWWTKSQGFCSRKRNPHSHCDGLLLITEMYGWFASYCFLMCLWMYFSWPRSWVMIPIYQSIHILPKLCEIMNRYFEPWQTNNIQCIEHLMVKFIATSLTSDREKGKTLPPPQRTCLLLFGFCLSTCKTV